MDESWTDIAGDPASRLLLIADHASNRVPPGIDLGIDAALLAKHIAIDIGVAALSRHVAALLGCPAILANVSRLVVDLHREADNPAAIPDASDGHAIPGNAHLGAQGRAERISRFWEPYHRHIDEAVASAAPRMLFTLHSFTPRLESTPRPERPWQVGILYNRDERAPRVAIPKLEALGLTVGDNEPYSGRHLNATMNRHAEARGLPYLAIEVRNDLIADEAGARKWAGILAPVIAGTRDALT